MGFLKNSDFLKSQIALQFGASFIRTADCLSKIPNVQIIYDLTYFVLDYVSYQQHKIVFLRVLTRVGSINIPEKFFFDGRVYLLKLCRSLLLVFCRKCSACTSPPEILSFSAVELLKIKKLSSRDKKRN